MLVSAYRGSRLVYGPGLTGRPGESTTCAPASARAAMSGPDPFRVDQLTTATQTPAQVRKGRLEMALPTLTPEQREAAQAKSREARQARSALLAGIKTGEETIPAVLDRAKSDPIAGKTKVSQLVRALPGYGPAKASAVLEQAGIPEDRRVAGLGARQREALVSALA